MPICSLAAAMLRSLEAMSGRRSSNCDGSMPGIAGIVGAADRDWVGRQREHRRRLSDKDGDRMFVHGALNVDIGGLHLRRLELRARLGHVGERRRAAVVAVLSKLQGALKGLDRVVEKLALGIGRTQIEVIDRQLGMQRKPRRFKVGSRGLRLFARLRDGAADASPQVDFVVKVERQNEVAVAVVGPGHVQVRLIIGVSNSADAGRCSDCWRLGRAIEADGRARRAKIRLCLFQGLVGRIDLGLERVKLRIVEKCPPVTFQLCVARLRGLPSVFGFEVLRQRFLERRRESEPWDASSQARHGNPRARAPALPPSRPNHRAR